MGASAGCAEAARHADKHLLVNNRRQQPAAEIQFPYVLTSVLRVSTALRWHTGCAACVDTLKSCFTRLSNSAVMVLKAEQHSQIAATYERVAADESLPPQLRVAFARKARWFRMLAQIGTAKATAVANERNGHASISKPASSLVDGDPKTCRPTLAERLSRVGAT
jgi:hypothetical protein